MYSLLTRGCVSAGVGVNELGKSVDRLKIRDGGRAAARNAANEVKLDEKVLHVCWHPTGNTIAVAGKVGLCLYKV